MPAPPPPSLLLSLAMAMVEASNAPLLLLDGGQTVVAASASFAQAFRIDRAGALDRPLSDLGAGEWDVPALRSLLDTIARGQASIEAYELDLRRPGQATRRLVVNARKLDYADEANIRLLVTVSDVTDAREAERIQEGLVRDKAILMEELQHRVANSLQIIASVLLQGARQVQSDETRSQLHAAHHRVMSVAAVQKQLAGTGGGEVNLRAYLNDLCRSLGASMIHDHDQLSLEVTVDDSVATGNLSISLGLIVTELVINALKHAFPNLRHGRIQVDYRSEGPDWSLSVRDDGVGMARPGSGARPGLGTSIVEALARQLGARIAVADARPGTAVSVIRETRAVPVGAVMAV